MRKLRARGVTAPVIGFPRGGGALAKLYAQEAETTAVALDTSTPMDFGRAIQALKPIQGALDPLALLAGGRLLMNEVDRLIDAWNEGPFVFNLGHGILPTTPMEHVGAVLDQIKMRGQ